MLAHYAPAAGLRVKRVAPARPAKRRTARQAAPLATHLLGDCAVWGKARALRRVHTRTRLPSLAGRRACAPDSGQSQGALVVQARNVLLFTRKEAARAGIALSLDDSRARHITSVLKSQSGDLIRVGVVNGLKGTALVKEVGERSVRLLWNTWQQPQAPPPISLLLAMPRPKVLRRLWSSLAEVGVSEVIVTAAHKVERGYETSRALRQDVILAEVLRGLEQAGDTILPAVLCSRSFQATLEYFGPGGRSGARFAAADSGNGAAPPLQEMLISSVARSRAATTAPPPPLPLAPPPDAPKRLAFITQCLNVRRSSEEERFRGAAEGLPGVAAAPLRSPSTAAYSPSDSDCTALVNRQFFSQLDACVTGQRLIPLKLVAHPSASILVSDAVQHYRKLMAQAGYSVWKLPETAQRAVLQDVDAIDHYYGSRAEAMRVGDPEPGSMGALLRAGGGSESEDEGGSTLEGALDVGTTSVDTRWWGDGQVVVAVGPEGGWTEWELREMQAAGFIPVGMGPRTLSSANAVVSLLAVIQESMRTH